MSFDRSRFIFDPRKSYFGVVMQQGRVQLDSDWNEWQAELARRIHAATLDILGLAGVPSTTPSAFQITTFVDNSQTPPLRVGIGTGRMYVDGILVENHGSMASPPWDAALAESSGTPQTPVDYTKQPYLPGAVLPTTKGPFLVYLDVWQREVTYLEDPNLVDKAVGIDTTGRYQIVWQVKFKDVGGVPGLTCSNPAIDPLKLFQPSASLLTTGTGGVSPATTGPCAISPPTGYTGLENQLYRVEIHQRGNASPIPPANPTAATTATFKWSRDNASVATAVTAISTNVLTVQSLGRDQVLGFGPGNWIEITCDSLELTGQTGELHQIVSINPAANTVTLDSAVSSSALVVNGQMVSGNHTRIQRWDQAGTVYQKDGVTVWADLNAAGNTAGIPVPPPGTVLVLENGITVAFDLAPSGGGFQTGDFWTFAARTADGSVETLTGAAPLGVHHHYCRLAIVDFTATPPVSDCRKLFPALANRSIHVIDVRIGTAPLRNDGSFTFQNLSGGINVVCDLPLSPAIVTQPNNPNSPICFLTVDIPATAPAGATAAAGFNPLILAATVTVSPSNTLNLVPRPGAPLPTGQPLLARLTLKGNAIWAADNPNVYLNGATEVIANSPTRLQLPTGDGRPYADFEMWFWLTAQPPVTLSATTINFPDQLMKTTSAPPLPSVTVTNNSATSLAISLTSGEFSQTNTSLPAGPPNSIPAGATSTISVSFTPIGIGPRPPGQITITDTSGASPQVVASITLNGNGIGPQLTITPDAALTFPTNQAVTTSSQSQTVTLTNTGSAPLTISAITLSDTTNYSQQNTCIPPTGGSVNLAIGASCAITVVFKPATVGTFNATLVITHNAPNRADPLPIQLTGTGVQGAPKLAATPTSLIFSPKLQTPHALTITNNGTAPLIIGPIVAPPNYTAGGCTASVAPNASCTISVSYGFIGPGGDSTLTIGHNDPSRANPLAISLSASDKNGVFP